MTNTRRQERPRSFRVGPSAYVAALLLTGACSGGGDPVLTLWEGTLQPIPPSTIEGSMAAVSQFGHTEASISIGQAEAGVTYGWRIESGDCQAPGEVQAGLAVYPPLTADEAGTASEEVVIGIVFRPNSRLAARIYRPLEGGGEGVLACGKFDERG